MTSIGHSRPRRSRFAQLAAATLLASLVTVVPMQSAQAAVTLLSQGRPATASSTENGGTPATAAVDGNPATRWSSQFSDPQWLRVDLGSTAAITQVVLQWEGAYATAYQIQVSGDGNNWTSIYSTTTSTGGTQTVNVTGSGRYVRVYGTARNGGYGYSLWEFKVYGDNGTTPPATGYVLANPQVTGVTPSTYNPPHAYFHEFQANCATSHDKPDDPIVYPGLPGASHMHTFMGNRTTNAASTLTSLNAGGTTCLAPGDKSGYWMPTMYNGSQVVNPVGPQVIYYKTGVNDYTSVRPFPPGLRFVVGSPNATADQFMFGSVEGWECGESYHNADFPAYCPVGTQVNVRYQAPSCWNGLYLDTPDHKSHMAYPVNLVCPASHPVALPMIEFKMAFPASGDMSQVRLSSGRGYSFHYDFFNAWDPATQAALVNHCVRGGLQCNARGYDETQPGRGAALNANYQLP
ncbi:hypothetical protein Cme02nite_75340 [Catellatospora methionotrophica]|uniref:F5/8 type C domain-containing protein n=1 Tax=Catellatospora methionotrophica TaxID=121620 RepID=A0A8J3PJ78_9ACTN|nr:DUF1996 domain-containing protein [Catellatospora methionotrophica]GIG19202.1 hypothetical protein Cme02nite_75340 [Catellatospora methionotrophica]